MAAIEDLYPLILPEVLGCPYPTVDQAIVRAAWDFCQDSLAWQVDLDPINVRASKETYELELPCDALLVVITRVVLDGTHKLEGIGTGKVSSTGHSTPSWIEVKVHPAPMQAGVLDVRVALKPRLTATELDCLLVDRYGDALAEGAKYRLKKMANQAWTDKPGSMECLAEFRRLTAEARISSEVERNRGPLTVKPIRFGAP